MEDAEPLMAAGRTALAMARAARRALVLAGAGAAAGWRVCLVGGAGGSAWRRQQRRQGVGAGAQVPGRCLGGLEMLG